MKLSTVTLCAIATIAATTTTATSFAVAEQAAATTTNNFATSNHHHQDERVLTSEAAMTPGQVADAVISIFKIAQSVAPLLSGMFGSGKKCHQLACWIAAPNYNCQFAAANQVQRELTKGRNSFAVESSTSSGMWVRYWRTQFSPPDRGAVADGKCGGGSYFQVSNCQETGKVYC